MNLALFRLLLLFYPAAFRQRWEEEMLQTFELQLADGWLDAWCCALSELPAMAAKGLGIPVISLAGSGLILFGLMWALGNGKALASVYSHLIAKLGG